MFYGDRKDIGLWQATRRKFLKIVALTGAASATGILNPLEETAIGKEGGMSPEEMRIRAMQLFKKPKLFQCAQATLAVGQEKLGKRDWEVVRAMGAFAGGLGANGDACGALCGGLAAIGLRFGRGGEDEKEDRKMWGCCLELMKRFREEVVQRYGSIRCREITGIDWMNRKQVTSFYIPDEIFLECTRIVGDTARLVGEILERQA